ncbi:MAG: glutathione S-transferase family protein, partial [Rhodospirillales bacterium]|nr:glutathione S-transferase family protein [Rhodospirillales bacterium]
MPFAMRTLDEPNHPEGARVNPKRQVPVLVDGDLEIFDSTRIFEYLEDLEPEPPIWPADPKARARARLLEHTSDEVFFPHVVRLMDLQGDLAGAAAAAARDAAVAYDRYIEASLAGRDFLAGAYSYADIAFHMAQVFADRLGAQRPPDVPRLLAWRERMTARPAVRKVASAM